MAKINKHLEKFTSTKYPEQSVASSTNPVIGHEGP
jgi:hypothetical protein